MANAANLKEVEDGKRRRAEIDKQQLGDIQFLLSTPEGKRFIWRLLQTCKVSLGPNESPAHSNGTIQSMQIGRQDVGREVIAWLSIADPSAYPTLMLEALRAERERQ